MNPILVFIDPAEDNVPVIAKAHYLAKRMDTSLILFASAFNASLANANPFASGTGSQTQTSYIREQERRLQQQATPLIDAGLTVSVRVVWNKNPWQAIKTFLEEGEGDCELIIKGTHHQNVVQRTFFSSTDWDLMRCCRLPILLVKNAPWPDEKMLLTACVDPIEHENQPHILDKAIVLQTKVWQSLLKARMEVLNVYDPTPFIVYMDPPVPDTTPITEALAEQHQESLDKLLDECGVERAQGTLEAGTPTSTIPEVLHQSGTHVAVMGAQTREGINRWLIGHTAEKVLDRISCDILVIKTDQSGG